MHRFHHPHGIKDAMDCSGHEFLHGGGGPHGRHGHHGRHHGGHGPGHWGPPPMAMVAMGGRRHRADRGEVRYLILDALVEEPRHGYDVIQSIKARSGGGYTPSPGTIYPTLQMLEESGHVTLEETGGKKVYTLADEGRSELDDNQHVVDDFYDRVSDEFSWAQAEEFHEILDRIPRVMRSVGRAYRGGRVDSLGLSQIAGILDDAIDRIETIAKGTPGK